MCVRLLVNKCAWTSEDNKNPLLQPIYVTLSEKFAIQEVHNIIKDKYEHIVVQEDYHEIFVKDHHYGVTISFLTEEGGTTISAYVHNKHNPYRKKKYLIKFLTPIREKLKDHTR